MKVPNQYLSDLARYLTAITSDQLRAHYFDGDNRMTLRALRKHAKQGFISVSVELVRERQHADLAITSHPVAQTSLPAQRIAYFAAQRWSEIVAAKIVARGTAKLSALYGGKAHTVLAASVSHDCALTDVFLSKRLADPAFEWELVQARPGLGALPDAITATGMIEVIGRYNGSTVAAKLEMSAQSALELW